MRFRFLPIAACAFAVGVFLTGLTGCSTLHSWAQASSGRPATAGASVSVPFGK